MIDRRSNGTGRRARRIAIVVVASMAIHAALLGPLLLVEPPEVPPPAQEADVGWILPIELTRRRQPATTRASATSEASPTAAVVAGPTTRAASRQENESAVEAAPIDDSWRYRPEAVVGPAFHIPGVSAARCVDLARLSESQRTACAEIQATHAAMQARIAAMDPAAIGPPPGPSRASRRDDDFERQAQANENWRDYTRGDGAYPGLRSLLKDR